MLTGVAAVVAVELLLVVVVVVDELVVVEPVESSRDDEQPAEITRTTAASLLPADSQRGLESPTASTPRPTRLTVTFP